MHRLRPWFRFQFRIRSLLAAVAVAACALGAAASYECDPATPGSLLAGWAALYGIPTAIILGRRTPLRRALRVWGKLTLLGLPVACLCCGLPGLLMSGLVGLVGNTLAVMIWIGLAALTVAALSADETATPDAEPDPLPCMSPVDRLGR
jgi:hypothetical protein